MFFLYSIITIYNKYIPQICCVVLASINIFTGKYIVRYWLYLFILILLVFGLFSFVFDFTVISLKLQSSDLNYKHGVCESLLRASFDIFILVFHLNCCCYNSYVASFGLFCFWNGIKKKDNQIRRVEEWARMKNSCDSQ